MTFYERIRNTLKHIVEQNAVGDADKYNNALRYLAKWRCVLLQNTFIKQYGTIVQSGPFLGMKLTDKSAEGCYLPKLLGCYEQPLAKAIEKVLSAKYDNVINVGCAEGYYVVGLALKSDGGTQIFAYDTDPQAQILCGNLAEINGVTDQINIAGELGHTDLGKFAGQKSILLCDIEGGEKELLDPFLAPVLMEMTIIVEAHEVLLPGIVTEISSRFEVSHDIEIIWDCGSRALRDLPEWFFQLAHLDQLLAVWEWRSGPTPWLIMVPK